MQKAFHVLYDDLKQNILPLASESAFLFLGRGKLMDVNKVCNDEFQCHYDISNKYINRLEI